MSESDTNRTPPDGSSSSEASDSTPEIDRQMRVNAARQLNPPEKPQAPRTVPERKSENSLKSSRSKPKDKKKKRPNKVKRPETKDEQTLDDSPFLKLNEAEYKGLLKEDWNKFLMVDTIPKVDDEITFSHGHNKISAVVVSVNDVGPYDGIEAAVKTKSFSDVGYAHRFTERFIEKSETNNFELSQLFAVTVRDPERIDSTFGDLIDPPNVNLSKGKKVPRQAVRTPQWYDSVDEFKDWLDKDGNGEKFLEHLKVMHFFMDWSGGNLESGESENDPATYRTPSPFTPIQASNVGLMTKFGPTIPLSADKPIDWSINRADWKSVSTLSQRKAREKLSEALGPRLDNDYAGRQYLTSSPGLNKLNRNVGMGFSPTDPTSLTIKKRSITNARFKGVMGHNPRDGNERDAFQDAIFYLGTTKTKKLLPTNLDKWASSSKMDRKALLTEMRESDSQSATARPPYLKTELRNGIRYIVTRTLSDEVGELGYVTRKTKKSGPSQKYAVYADGKVIDPPFLVDASGDDLVPGAYAKDDVHSQLRSGTESFIVHQSEFQAIFIRKDGGTVWTPVDVSNTPDNLITIKERR